MQQPENSLIIVYPPPLNSRGCNNMQKNNRTGGFTLIELSIVMVIIGLIIGGVLTGQDLINAATIRAQISQIEKYSTAARTFELKYGYLPGDIPDPTASAFGFKPRGTHMAEGDGNGVIEGNFNPNDINGWNYANGGTILCGETGMFWVDLSTAGLIGESFSLLSPSAIPNTGGAVSWSGNVGDIGFLGSYFPKAKISNSYIYVWSGGYLGTDGKNYFGMMSSNSTVCTSAFLGQCGNVASNAKPFTMSVNQAYNIDAKIDDGLPQSGKVTAQYLNGATRTLWIVPGMEWGVPTTAKSDASTTTCLDNSNSATITGVAGQPRHYSLGAGTAPSATNCSLSFEFQ